MLILILLPVAFLLPPRAGAGEIVGGHEAKPHSRPYMAFLDIQHGDRYRHCGGFLVAKNFVLTAAHCQGESEFMNQKNTCPRPAPNARGAALGFYSGISVYLGAHNLSHQEPSRQVIPVSWQIPHPRYNKKTFNNDIMLLQLAYPPNASEYVKTLALPHAGERVDPRSVCSVAGWGLTVPGDVRSAASALQEVDVDVLDDGNCMYHSYNPITMLCAGDRWQRKDSAGGDSGGPLVCEGKAQGIVSWGFDAPPGVYTRVSSYTHWIQDILRRWKP
ncbi:mast cell protease 1A-like isoform X2 [Pelodiscus sinensis]|uniref:mast cell protease 1A-like isoform X2 n=1 Tax=Pelodiscus sinensis TaxID=13735 RepID=UPI003F6C3D28